MSFVHIKKIQKPDADNTMRDYYAVPSVAIATPQGKKLIPNPSGTEATLFESLEEAESAIKRAGFDYIFEGKKTYTLGQVKPGGSKAVLLTGQAPEQAIPILIEHLQDREPAVVANSAFALGAMRATSALQAMGDILGHDDPTVRKNVAEAMARMGHSALPYLKDAFEAAQSSPHKNAPYVRLTIISAFLEMILAGAAVPLTEQILPLATRALEDENWLVRAQAALVLGHAARVLEEEQARQNAPPAKKRLPGIP